jgi:hypothetical protein
MKPSAAEVLNCGQRVWPDRKFNLHHDDSCVWMREDWSGRWDIYDPTAGSNA